jgi:hypothetical protein
MVRRPAPQDAGTVAFAPKASRGTSDFHPGPDGGYHFTAEGRLEAVVAVACRGFLLQWCPRRDTSGGGTGADCPGSRHRACGLASPDARNNRKKRRRELPPDFGPAFRSRSLLGPSIHQLERTWPQAKRRDSNLHATAPGGAGGLDEDVAMLDQGPEGLDEQCGRPAQRPPCPLRTSSR